MAQAEDAAQGPITKLIFVRHAESTFNAAIKQGVEPCIRDATLTPKGLAQAAQGCEDLAHLLSTCCPQGKPDAIFVSPLRRALDTCLLVCPFDTYAECEYRVCPALRECISGTDDIGSTAQTLQSSYPAFNFDDLEPVWWSTPAELQNIPEEEIFEVYCESPERFKSCDNHGLRDRLDSFIALLQARMDSCVVIVAHRKLIGLLTTRMGLREQDQERREALATAKNNRGFEKGIWLNSCEAQLFDFDWNVWNTRTVLLKKHGLM